MRQKQMQPCLTRNHFLPLSHWTILALHFRNWSEWQFLILAYLTCHTSETERKLFQIFISLLTESMASSCQWHEEKPKTIKCKNTLPQTRTHAHRYYVDASFIMLSFIKHMTTEQSNQQILAIYSMVTGKLSLPKSSPSNTQVSVPRLNRNSFHDWWYQQEIFFQVVNQQTTKLQAEHLLLCACRKNYFLGTTRHWTDLAMSLSLLTSLHLANIVLRSLAT